MILAILTIFILGYLAIALEHVLKINKTAIALLIGTTCWAIYLVDLPELLPADSIPAWFEEVSVDESQTEIPLHYAVEVQHLHQTGEIAGILFYLIGAMTIVELIDVHDGFALITRRIRTTSKRGLLWFIGLLTFFLSATLDDLTTTIVMVSVLKKLIDDQRTRWQFVGVVVIAANCGGAWTVIGDVTTTMLWIHGKIEAIPVMTSLFLGSVTCLLVPLIGMSIRMPGTLSVADQSNHKTAAHVQHWHQVLFLTLGIAGLLFVPIFKAVTHLPPYMGMMFSLALLWIVSEFVGRTLDEKDRSSTGVAALLNRIDHSSVLFFLGILMAVGALSATGILHTIARSMDNVLPNHQSVALVIGLVSSVLDNVSLVAAGIEMYSMPTNDEFWMLLAYCAGTGGSCLIIGSAAGVASMGLDNVNFFWYVKNISGWALLGYLSGAAVVIATLAL